MLFVSNQELVQEVRPPVLHVADPPWHYIWNLKHHHIGVELGKKKSLGTAEYGPNSSTSPETNKDASD